MDAWGLSICFPLPSGLVESSLWVRTAVSWRVEDTCDRITQRWSEDSRSHMVKAPHLTAQEFPNISSHFTPFPFHTLDPVISSTELTTGEPSFLPVSTFLQPAHLRQVSGSPSATCTRTYWRCNGDVVLQGSRWSWVSQRMDLVELRLGTLTEGQGHPGSLSPKHLTPCF